MTCCERCHSTTYAMHSVCMVCGTAFTCASCCEEHVRLSHLPSERNRAVKWWRECGAPALSKLAHEPSPLRLTRSTDATLCDARRLDAVAEEALLAQQVQTTLRRFHQYVADS